MPSASHAAHGGYASIMVQLDLGESAGPRVALAAALAGRLGARLIGVAAAPLALPYLGDGMATLDATLVDDARNLATGDLAKAEQLFRERSAALAGVEWRASVEPTRDFILAQSRAADLVVVGRPGATESGGDGMEIVPGDLVLALGRPLLVTPPGVSSLEAKRVVVAWKDSREARRAVRDALPFLTRAEMVTILSLGAEAGEQGEDDVSAYLDRHGVAARAVLRRDVDGYLTDALVGFAQEQAADLIVCGAFGRSRMQEWLFGGMTRDLLQRTPVCCLMSH